MGGCGTHASTPADMAATTDFSILGPFACVGTLADACAQMTCPQSPADIYARYCPDGGADALIYEATCDGFSLISVYFVDTGEQFVFDPAGQLYAIIHIASPGLGPDGGVGCSGPPMLELVACSHETLRCARR